MCSKGCNRNLRRNIHLEPGRLSRGAAAKIQPLCVRPPVQRLPPDANGERVKSLPNISVRKPMMPTMSPAYKMGRRITQAETAGRR